MPPLLLRLVTSGIVESCSASALSPWCLQSLLSITPLINEMRGMQCLALASNGR